MYIALLGDSIFDNARYVPDEAPVVKQLQSLLPRDSKAALLAVDGSVTTEVVSQVDRLPRDATHLVISSGGNDALHASLSIGRSDGALEILTIVQQEFRNNYRRLAHRLKKAGKPTVVCTIYDAVPNLEPWQRTALSVFNDVIISEASRFGFPVIDLRPLCNEASDYSALSPIEPSSKGGMKIAKRISLVVKEFNFESPQTVLF